ncbi:MAG TPA: type II secretion system protein [Thermoanaerobaculia bacterium]
MPPGEPPRRTAPRRRGEAGYNLVILVVAITVMGILLAIALPSWGSIIRRDREEELIFRGFQYAEAIRCFFNRYRRYPVRLDELIETSPRSIRQLWKDPMTEDGKWRLLFRNGPGVPLQPQVPTANPSGNGQGKDSQGRDGKDAGNNPDAAGQPDGTGKQEIQPVGPIIGVASRSSKEAFLTFNGRQRYDEWEFTVDMLNGTINRGPGAPPGIGLTASRGLTLNIRWLGRPLPQDLVPPGANQPTVPGGGPGGPGGLGVTGPGKPPSKPSPTPTVAQ